MSTNLSVGLTYPYSGACLGMDWRLEWPFASSQDPKYYGPILIPKIIRNLTNISAISCGNSVRRSGFSGLEGLGLDTPLLVHIVQFRHMPRSPHMLPDTSCIHLSTCTLPVSCIGDKIMVSLFVARGPSVAG